MGDAPTPFTPRNGAYPVVLVIGGTSQEVRALIGNLEVRGMRVTHWEAGKQWAELPPSTDVVILIRGGELPKARLELGGADVVVIETQARWATARSALIRRGVLQYWAQPRSVEPPPPEAALAPPPASGLPGPAPPAVARSAAPETEARRRFRDEVSALAGTLSDRLPVDVEEVVITASRLRIEFIITERRKKA